MRLGQQAGEALLRVGGHAQRVQPELRRALVQQAQHQAFAVGGGQRRYAHIDMPPGQFEADAAVLGQAFFGDVEIGHDLDARCHRRVQATVGLGDVAQHAVAPQAHHRMAFVGFDVYVGSAFAHRLGQQRVDHADDGRVVLAVEQVGDCRKLGHQLLDVDVLADVGDHFGGTVVAAAVGVGQACVEVLGRDAGDADRDAELTPHFGQRGRIGVVTQDQRGARLVHALDEDAVALGEAVGEGRRCLHGRAYCATLTMVASRTGAGFASLVSACSAAAGRVGGGASLRSSCTGALRSRCWPIT